MLPHFFIHHAALTLRYNNLAHTFFNPVNTPAKICLLKVSSSEKKFWPRSQISNPNKEGPGTFLSLVYLITCPLPPQNPWSTAATSRLVQLAGFLSAEWG